MRNSNNSKINKENKLYLRCQLKIFRLQRARKLMEIGARWPNLIKTIVLRKFNGKELTPNLHNQGLDRALIPTLKDWETLFTFSLIDSYVFIHYTYKTYQHLLNIWLIYDSSIIRITGALLDIFQPDIQPSIQRKSLPRQTNLW